MVKMWHWVLVSLALVVACQAVGRTPGDVFFEVAVLVAGMDGPTGDPIRTSNTLTLNLRTLEDSQVLPLTAGNGTYTFAQTYTSLLFLDLQVQKQPDEYFCHRADAINAATAPTTLLQVQCDYLGPEFVDLFWDVDAVTLGGGGIELRQPDATPDLYGLWTSLRYLEDAYLEITLARVADTVDSMPDAGTLRVILPGRPVAGEVLELQPNDFVQGAEVPAGQAAVVYVTQAGHRNFSVGSLVVTQYGLDVVSRTARIGSLAIAFSLEATVNTELGVSSLQGLVLLSATNDAARAPGSFRAQDAKTCLYDPGQTVAINAAGLRCRDAVAQGDYYRPVYTVATACIESDEDLTQFTRACIRTQDDRCDAVAQFPRCE